MVLSFGLEKEILQLIKQGNENAFRTIFNSYYPKLLAFSKEYVKDQEVAKNLVQESFLKLWENRFKLRDDSNLKAYLLKVLRNKALNYLKAEKVKLKYEEQMKHQYNELVLNIGALNQLDFDMLSLTELNDIIERTIRQLPPQCRRVFELSRHESLKNKEIADQLGISIKAVEGHISRALCQLRKQLKIYFPTEVFTIFISLFWDF